MFGSITLISKAQVSGTYTINSAVETSGTNFQSFSEAADYISGGVNGPVIFNVVVNPDSYFDQVTILPVPGTSTTNTITFNCNGATMEFTSSNSSMRAGVKLDGAHHIIFDGLKMISHTVSTEFSYGWGFGLLRDADSNIIRNCTITVENNSQYLQNTLGILIGGTDDYPNSNGLSDCDGNIITNNTIIGGNYGIILDNYAGNLGLPITTANGNQITNNTIKNFINEGIGILWSSGTLIEGNDIALSNSYGSGIDFNEYNSKFIIRNNKIHNFSDSVITSGNHDAITVTYTNPATADDGNLIVNNLVYNFNTPGAQNGINISNCSFLNIYHNTIVMDGQTDNGDDVNGFAFDGPNVSVNAINNIVVINSASTSDQNAVYTNATNSTVNLNNNDLYNKTGFTGHYNGNNYTTLTEWQTASGKDYHSVSVDPVFTDTTAHNYKPTNNTIDNLALYVNVATDITGAPRSNTSPDMGAYEFLASPCSTPPVAGAAKSLPGAIVCAGSPITIAVTGNSGGVGQTYQWQTSATETGTYTNAGAPMITPSLDTLALTSLYYRLQVSCASVVAYTVPVFVKANTGLPAGTYTIDKTSPSSETNFASFADVLATFKCGILGPVVFNVAPASGPYEEQVIFPAITGSSAANTVTINGNGETLSYLSTSSQQRATLKLDGASNMVLDSLNVTAEGSDEDEEYGFGIQLINNADNNIIQHCHINVTPSTGSEEFAGIVVSAKANNATSTGAANLCDSNQFIGNTITGGYYGLTLTGSTTPSAMINNNKVINNKFLDFYNVGIYIAGTNNTLVEGNDFSRPARTNSGSVYGIYVTSLSTGLKVSKNRVHNLFESNAAATNSTYGIYTSSSAGSDSIPNIYSNNLIYNIKGTTGFQYGIYNSGSGYAHYYNNTISLDDSLTTSTNNTRGFSQTGNSAGLEFKDNIISIHRSNTGINYGIYIGGTAGMLYAANNNDYNITSATGTNNIGYYNTVSYTTLADWQAASLKDSASLIVNPVFSNTASGDLRFTNILLDNKGTPVGITTDIDGDARSATTPDMGAYEIFQTLPVKMIGLTAVKAANNVLVNWATVTELNSRNFVVERSTDGVTFTSAGTLTARGMSNTLQQYNFTDINAANLATKVLYYRIRAVDIDGRFDYTKIVSVNLSSRAVIAVTVFPNPYVTELYARITAENAGKATIEIKDAAGRSLASQVQNVPQGTTIVAINKVSRLPAGIYFVSVTIGGVTYLSRVAK